MNKLDIKTAKEVITCMPEGKTAFSYYKDRYAPFILSQAIEIECRVTNLKHSVYSRLLNKSMVKTIIAQSGNRILHHEQLAMVWAEPSIPFLLTLDTWGHNDRGWDQVSRSGHNIVLQLNFSNQHDELSRKLVKPDDDHRFQYYGHPVMRKGERDLFRETLA